jgi:hypothetical protein
MMAHVLLCGIDCNEAIRILQEWHYILLRSLRMALIIRSKVLAE